MRPLLRRAARCCCIQSGLYFRSGLSFHELPLVLIHLSASDMHSLHVLPQLLIPQMPKSGMFSPFLLSEQFALGLPLAMTLCPSDMTSVPGLLPHMQRSFAPVTR